MHAKKKEKLSFQQIEIVGDLNAKSRHNRKATENNEYGFYVNKMAKQIIHIKTKQKKNHFASCAMLQKTELFFFFVLLVISFREEEKKNCIHIAYCRNVNNT